jgi:hypothetical protein
VKVLGREFWKGFTPGLLWAFTLSSITHKLLNFFLGLTPFPLPPFSFTTPLPPQTLPFGLWQKETYTEEEDEEEEEEEREDEESTEQQDTLVYPSQFVWLSLR